LVKKKVSKAKTKPRKSKRAKKAAKRLESTQEKPVQQASQITEHAGEESEGEIFRVRGFTESAKKVEQLKGVPVELKEHKIVTAFDQVYDLVKKTKRIKLGSIAKELGLSRKAVEDCTKILEDENLVEVEYPAIGDPLIEIVEYREWKKQHDLEEEETKKLGKEKEILRKQKEQELQKLKKKKWVPFIGKKK